MLSRRWSRIIVLIRIIGVAAALGPIAFKASQTGIVAGLLFSGVMLFLTFYLMKKKLICPNCGGDNYVPAWKADAVGRCRNCGQPWRFDDEV